MKRCWPLLALILFLSGLNLPAQAAGGEAALPLSRVVLFSSGVGYFQRDGQVEGNASLELSFRAADVNDLLKSLVLRDLDGGQVTGVTYTSRDPLARSLRSFAIDLTGSPDLAAILAQTRGEPLEVVSSDILRGALVGLEAKENREGVVETYLNLLTERGLRSIALSQIQEVRFLNPQLDKELRAALALLAQSHSQDRKRMVLTFSGKGKRRVQVGYLLETPVWKTSYRMVLGAEQSHFLQGWAIVENTTDQDWKAVKLALVSGRPVSFVMDLYQPLYLPRPLVQPELYANLRPQKYDEDLSAPPPPAPSPKSAKEAAPARSRAAGAAAPAAKALAGEAYEEAEYAPVLEPMDLRQGVAAAASAGEAGSFFQYAISFPVTLQRQESAMLPIVGQDVEGRRYSIYNEKVHPKHPMHGLKLKNSTALTLMGGPITLFEAGTYAGDAQIDTLPAGAERLVSFALDLETEVSPVARSQPDLLVAVRISRGTLVSTVTLRREKSYTVKASGTKAREVLIEHPLSPDWQLVQPKQAEERTRDLYRFLVKAAPSPSAPAVQELLVAEERKVDQSVAVSNLSDDLIAFYIKAPVVSAKVKEALNGLARRKADLADTLRQRQEQERKAQSIRGEQGRIRQNMDSLSRDSALYKRYVAQLDSQENEMAAILPEIDRLAKKELDQRKALDEYILSIDVK
jgi:hypothetical protein